MCFGGGGGGGIAAMEKANVEADKREEERQDRIAETQAAVNAAFAPEQTNPTANTIAQNIYNKNINQLAGQADDVSLANKFALARSGQLGSSVDIGTGRELQEAMNTGVMEAGSLADQARNSYLSTMEGFKNNLMSRAASGEAQDSLLADVTQQQALKAAQTQNQFAGQTMGDVFAGVGQGLAGWDAGARAGIQQRNLKNILGQDYDDSGMFFAPSVQAGQALINKIG